MERRYCSLSSRPSCCWRWWCLDCAGLGNSRADRCRPCPRLRPRAGACRNGFAGGRVAVGELEWRGVCRGEVERFFPPHPGPLPWGEGESSAVLETFQPPARSPLPSELRPEGGDGILVTRNDPSRPSLSPLPEGEGKGEGERRVGSASTPLLLAQANTSATRSASRLQGGDTADYKSALPGKALPLAESVTQDIRIEDKFVLGTAKIRWQAEKGDPLPLLFEPTVLIGLDYPTNTLDLVQAPAGSRAGQQLLARKKGVFDIKVRYELPVTAKNPESGFALPVPYGLVNRLNLTVVNLDVDVLSPQAVSIQRDTVGSNTVASLVLSPASDAWVGWKPRSRDVKREKPVFYADISQLYVPAAGVIEGAHYVAIRPAQGELGDLVLDVPTGTTITDVIGSGSPTAAGAQAGASVAVVSLWRFDPDTRKLRVTLNPAQSRPFSLLVRSQVATGTLPFEHSVGLVAADNAAGQIGLLGVATGNEVQLDTVSAEPFSPINLEDFPAYPVSVLQPQIPGLTLRRAFRYSDTKAVASVKASAVEPDIRVETQDTLSLGEDRTLLAATAAVDITRAGIFRLSFVMPAGFDVESISGGTLSHWTELKSDAGRVITLHLGGKTVGQQQFAITLSGPGVKATNAWAVPQLVLREASKQQGTLLLVPEQGMRLQVTAREGVTQLDPEKSGIRQKGVLAFRVLQTPWNLSLGIEQVNPWIQVTSLEHATVNEALVKVAANLQYQIDNAGLKAFRILVPTNAEGLRFQGDQVADFLPVPGAVTNGLQEWEVKLHRRVIGAYLLQATYQTLMPDKAAETVLRGLQAADVNLQRGFVTVQAGGRLQVRIDAPPAALQPTEWQSIPRALQQNLPAAAANFAYRLVEPAFALPLQLERHEAAKLLPARVNNITFTSVVSDDGEMLTQVRLEMVPGRQALAQPDAAQGRALLVCLRQPERRVAVARAGPHPDPAGAAVARRQSHPGGGVLQLAHRHPREGERPASPNSAGSVSEHSLDLELVAPKFDLPLENLTWRVSLSDKWRLKHWAGSLQLQQEEVVPRATTVDLQTYLQNEAGQQRERTKEARNSWPRPTAPSNTAIPKWPAARSRPLTACPPPTPPSTRTPACNCTISSSRRRSSA